MAVQLRLNVDQISAAIVLLSQTEKRELKQRLPLIIDIDHPVELLQCAKGIANQLHSSRC